MSNEEKPTKQQEDEAVNGKEEPKPDEQPKSEGEDIKPASAGEDAAPDQGNDEAAQDAKDAAGENTVDGEPANAVEEDAKDSNKSPAAASKKQKRQSNADEKDGGGSAPKRRRSTRGSKSDASSADPKKIIEFLLSDKPLEMMEKLDLGAEGFRFPRDRLNPFQDLLAACMISKPFSHVLGTRAINELFAKEHSALDTPSKTVEFGQEKILEVLHKAKTLHKDKTAGQLFGIAETCANDYGDDAALDKLREEAEKDVDAEHDLIVKTFKGYGPKTVDIFFRRVQVDWQEVYPFADDSTLEAARQVGLNIKDAQELAEVVKDATGADGKALREKYGRVVDVVVYLGLEGKTDHAIEAISSSS